MSPDYLSEEKPKFRIRAVLSCGATLDIVQPSPNMDLVVTVTPKDGIPISDAAQIKDNKLVLRVTLDSMYAIQDILGNYILDNF